MNQQDWRAAVETFVTISVTISVCVSAFLGLMLYGVVTHHVMIGEDVKKVPRSIEECMIQYGCGSTDVGTIIHVDKDSCALGADNGLKKSNAK